MTVLALDTASPVFALAVEEADGSVTVVTGGDPSGRSSGLLSAIETLLAGRPPLSALVVVTGPGSYAGIRTGIATAEALAMARGVATVGVGTLEALAEAAGAGPHLIVHPAGRGEWWRQEARDGLPTGQPALERPECLAGLRATGEGASAFGGSDLGPRERVVGALRAGLRRLAGGQAGTVRPHYGREPYITQSSRPGPQGRAMEEPSNVR